MGTKTKEGLRRLKFIEEKLKKQEYKFTPQRKAILDVLIENSAEHLTTEEVYELVKLKNSNIGLATIYRTLQLLDECGIVKKLNFGDSCYRYELSEEKKHQHHHLVCLNCGRIYEFDDDLLEELEQKIAEKNDFKVVDHMVKILGYCSRCKDGK